MIQPPHILRQRGPRASASEGASGACPRWGEIGENVWGQRSELPKVRFADPCHDAKPWTTNNRVLLYVKLPCPSVSTSCSKVRSDDATLTPPTQMVNF